MHVIICLCILASVVNMTIANPMPMDLPGMDIMKQAAGTVQGAATMGMDAAKQAADKSMESAGQAVQMGMEVGKKGMETAQQASEMTSKAASAAGDAAQKAIAPAMQSFMTAASQAQEMFSQGVPHEKVMEFLKGSMKGSPDQSMAMMKDTMQQMSALGANAGPEQMSQVLQQMQSMAMTG